MKMESGISVDFSDIFCHELPELDFSATKIQPHLFADWILPLLFIPTDSLQLCSKEHWIGHQFSMFLTLASVIQMIYYLLTMIVYQPLLVQVLLRRMVFII
jgi:hypothetical protein